MRACARLRAFARRICEPNMAHSTALALRSEDYSWPHIPLSRRPAISSQAQLFQRIAAAAPLPLALSTSKEERDHSKENSSTLVYGEIGTK